MASCLDGYFLFFFFFLGGMQGQGLSQKFSMSLFLNCVPAIIDITAKVAFLRAMILGYTKSTQKHKVPFLIKRKTRVFNALLKPRSVAEYLHKCICCRPQPLSRLNMWISNLAQKDCLSLFQLDEAFGAMRMGTLG